MDARGPGNPGPGLDQAGRPLRISDGEAWPGRARRGQLAPLRLFRYDSGASGWLALAAEGRREVLAGAGPPFPLRDVARLRWSPTLQPRSDHPPRFVRIPDLEADSRRHDPRQDPPWVAIDQRLPRFPPDIALPSSAQATDGGSATGSGDAAHPRRPSRPRPRTEARASPPARPYAAETPTQSAVVPTKSAPKGVLPTNTKA